MGWDGMVIIDHRTSKSGMGWDGKGWLSQVIELLRAVLDGVGSDGFHMS